MTLRMLVFSLLVASLSICLVSATRRISDEELAAIAEAQQRDNFDLYPARGLYMNKREMDSDIPIEPWGAIPNPGGALSRLMIHRNEQ